VGEGVSDGVRDGGGSDGETGTVGLGGAGVRVAVGRSGVIDLIEVDEIVGVGDMLAVLPRHESKIPIINTERSHKIESRVPFLMTQ
jgi:hypothetical protein